MRRLIEKTERFIKNLRWRAFFFLNPEKKPEDKETYGFNSRRAPPVIPELTHFENKMIDIIQGIKFGNQTNEFQKKLKDDLR